MTNLSRGTPYTLTGTDELDFSTSNGDIRLCWSGASGTFELYATFSDSANVTQEVLERTYTDASRVIPILAINTHTEYRLKYSGGAGGTVVMN